MIAQMIRCDSIDMPPLDKKERSFKKDFARELADSIRLDGLLNPIAVRPHPTKPGRYLLVTGRHRLHAVDKVLKWDEIAANILAGMGDEDAALASCAENLFRFPMAKPQHYVALQRWHAKYEADHPDKVGRGGRRDGSGRKPQRDTAAHHAVPSAEPTSEAEPADTAAPAPEPVPTFSEVVAAATGCSINKSKVATKIARSFSPEQLEVLDQMQVGTVAMRTVAGIKDDDQRGQVVNLIAIGTEPAAAIAEVTKPADGKVKLYDGNKTQVGPPPDADPDDALTDKEWADKYCIDVLRRLKNSALFLADAALYRATEAARAEFRSKTKKALAAAKGVGARGGLYGTISRLVNLSHPKHWLVCGSCRGEGSRTGSSGLAEKCPECPGGGFVLKTETYR